MKVDLKEIGFLTWIGLCVFLSIFFSMVLVGGYIGLNPFFDGWFIIPLIGVILTDFFVYIKVNKPEVKT